MLARITAALRTISKDCGSAPGLSSVYLAKSLSALSAAFSIFLAKVLRSLLVILPSALPPCATSTAVFSAGLALMNSIAFSASGPFSRAIQAAAMGRLSSLAACSRCSGGKWATIGSQRFNASGEEYLELSRNAASEALGALAGLDASVGEEDVVDVTGSGGLISNELSESTLEELLLRVSKLISDDAVESASEKKESLSSLVCPKST
uniref:Uncharacterized protein n=1 Tax=Pseudomonas cannabina TaxID=86840 RepID=I0BVZ2_PSECA|nr:hypothetical protein [Pseudomonas cannabina]